MKRNMLVVALVASVLGLSMWQACTAQGENRFGSSGHEARIALVDIAHIFKNYKKFTRLSDQMKADVKNRDQELRKLQESLQGLLKQRSQLTPGSTTYKQMEQKIAQNKAQLELMADTARREFQRREANLYYQTYREVEQVIQKYARSRGITLVLRNSRNDGVNQSNPQDVIKRVSQQVVYAQPTMDITEVVLAALNQSGGAVKQRTSGPSNSSNRPTYRTTSPGSKRSLKK